MINGKISHWLHESPSEQRPPLDGQIAADICIIGGGFTGLWSAYHAAHQFPGARIVVLDKEHLGYGASGRNAGWLSALVPGNRAVYARSAGSKQAAVHLQQRMIDSVDEVLGIIQEHDLDARAYRSGNLVVARTPAALQRLKQRRANDVKWGYPENEVRLLTAQESQQKVRIDGALGGLFFPTVGRVDPGRLVKALGQLCESLGVTIFESTEVSDISDSVVTTSHGAVNAPIILRATEGYTGTLSDNPRGIIPINSSIIITDPIPDHMWQRIGWENHELVSDAAHVFVYLQKTDDGRILIGGRGTPYRYASGIVPDGTTDTQTIQTLTTRLHQLFPDARNVPIAHAWSGVLGVTRDWCATVDFDRSSGIGHAQGYAGHGVTTAYLAAKSLVELAAGKTDNDAALPWVGHRARSWEPEPVRWLGVHGMYRLFRLADAQEERNQAGQTSRLARLGGRLAGLAE